MADIDSLYPQPVAPGSGNALLSNPTNAVSLMQGVAALRGQNIANETNLMAQQQAAQKAVSSLMGGYLAGIPNPGADDVNSAAAFAARSFPEIAIRYPGIISNARSLAINDPRGVKYGAGLLVNSQLSPTEGMARIAGPPSATGAPTTVPQAAANLTGAYPTGLGPGQPELIGQPAHAYLADEQQSATIQANLRKLQTVYPMVQELNSPNFGPGSAEYAKVRGALTTAGIINPNDSDLKVRQEVGKYLLNYAQGAQNAGRSDHALSAAIASNPNLDLTQPANLALIRNQIGFDRADSSIPVLFNQLHPGDTEKRDYLQFKANFYRNYDQRAFTYDMMSPLERRQLIDSLGKPGSPAYTKFARTYAELKSAGFLTPNGQQ